MSADDTKLAASSSFNSLKNFTNPASQSTLFTGSIASLGFQTHTITIAIPRAEGMTASLLFNYSGAPNDSTKWLFGPVSLSWGTVTLDGGWGDVAIKTVVTSTASQFTILLTAFNGDVALRNIVTPVTVTVRAALFIAPFH